MHNVLASFGSSFFKRLHTRKKKFIYIKSEEKEIKRKGKWANVKKWVEEQTHTHTHMMSKKLLRICFRIVANCCIAYMQPWLPNRVSSYSLCFIQPLCILFYFIHSFILLDFQMDFLSLNQSFCCCTVEIYLLIYVDWNVVRIFFFFWEKKKNQLNWQAEMDETEQAIHVESRTPAQAHIHIKWKCRWCPTTEPDQIEFIERKTQKTCNQMRESASEREREREAIGIAIWSFCFLFHFIHVGSEQIGIAYYKYQRLFKVT